MATDNPKRATTKIGRPTKYTEQLADLICERLANGESLRSVAKDPKLPSAQTMFSWMRKYPMFLEQYTRAKQESADAMAEEILDISDDGSNDWMEVNHGDSTIWKSNGEALQRSRLRVDTRKWLMAKMKPKKYGDKIDMTTNGKDLPTPILGGLSKQDEVSRDNSAS